MSDMYTEQSIAEYDEIPDVGIELKAHKRMKRIMRITQEIEQEASNDNEYIA